MQKASPIGGTALPTRISSGVSGDTSNCSNVPSSRSRATDRAVRISAVIASRIDSSEGRVAISESPFGLNQTRVVSVVSGVASESALARSSP